MSISTPRFSRRPVNSASPRRSSLRQRATLGHDGLAVGNSRDVVLGRRDIAPARAAPRGMRAGAEARATRRRSSTSGCGATRGQAGTRSRFRTARSRPRRASPSPTRTSRRRRRRAAASSRADRSPASAEDADTPRGCRAKGDPASTRNRRRRPTSSHCATSCPGSHIMRSMLTLSNPAARASRDRVARRARPSAAARGASVLHRETTGRRSSDD